MAQRLPRAGAAGRIPSIPAQGCPGPGGGSTHEATAAPSTHRLSFRQSGHPRVPARTMMDLKVDEEEVDSGQPVSIQAFASSSTLHGLSHIFSYERLSLKRVVWALCFLGSLALLALVCTNRIQYYFLYPHVTKLDEVAATRLTFPAVTFCNLNEFRFSRVTKNDLYHAGELLALLNNRWVLVLSGGPG